MVEFNGYLSGEAKRYFEKRAVVFGQKIVFSSLLVFFPLIFILSLKSNNWSIVGMYSLSFPLMYLITLIPKSKKERKKIIPKRIYTEENCIICVADSYSESKLIEDVKVVFDCGEYYDIRFYFGNMSEKYICQKSLLTNGTIEEFERLFEGKIKRRSE